MRNLKIHKRLVPHPKSSKAGDFFGSAAFIIIGIACIPLILIAWVITLLSNSLTEKNHIKKEPGDNWFLIDTPGDFEFSLICVPIDSSSVSEAVAGFFDNEQLFLYETVPPIEFFDDYFTTFKIEQPDGMFIQKALFDKELEEIVAMPLYFFDYQTIEAEEIHDLKEYVLLDTKGSPRDFLFTASGEQHDLEIRITRS